MNSKFVVGVLACALLAATALTPARAADMTTDRALNPQREPQNWILHHGNYQGHRYSLLKEINTDTVKNLKPVFTVALSGFQSGGRYAFGNLEATPIVEDGIMYVPDGWGSVYAIDLTAGKKGIIKWKMDPGTDRAWAGDVACCGVNNRGVALWKDKVISIALDGRMFAINKATGEVVWERKIADPAIAEALTIAPLVVRDLAIVGTAGGEFGIRGFIEATDLNTGKAAWRTYTIPGTGEPGNETWKDGKDHWKHGGGSVWETATYDPDTDTFYQGIGNAGPDWDAEYRPGDNKWAASVLAVNAADGKIKWGYQYTPNDPYDFDEISEHPIINAKVNGEDRKLVVHAARNGFFYALDRTQRLVRRRQAVCRQVELDARPRPQDRQAAQLRSRCRFPDLQCRAATAPAPSRRAHSYARRTSAARTGSRPPTIRSSACSTSPRSRAATSSRRWCRRTWRTRAAPPRCASASPAAASRRRTGSMAASRRSIPPTGEIKASLRLTYPNYSGALATAGNLVFLGHMDGTLHGL